MSPHDVEEDELSDGAKNSDGRLSQNDAGVDVAENIAAKNALQNNSRKLLDRIVPKLAN
jgi:hypothetical protein